MEHKLEKIKQHVKKHKTTYIVGASCVAAGVAAGYFLRRQPVVIAPVISPVFNNSNQQINFGGHMTKMVECLETGDIWKTITEAAEATGASMSLMSRHLNGYKSDVYGQHFKIVGVGTTG